MTRIQYLDGLRGVASLIVVFYHMVQIFLPTIYNGVIPNILIYKILLFTPFNLVYAGKLSVIIFFVLSGFVLSYNFFLTRNSLPLYANIVKRYIRLVIPIFFAVLMVFIFLELHLYLDQEIRIISNSSEANLPSYKFRPSIIDAGKCIFLGAFFSGSVSYLPVLWTMKYEFFGSCLVFCLIYCFKIFGKNRYRIFFYLAGLLSIFISSYYLCFIIGMILSDLYANRFLIIQNKKIRYLFFIIGVVLGSYSVMNVDSIFFTTYSLKLSTTIIICIMSASFLIISILTDETLKKPLSSQFAKYLGHISFSMYLIHPLVLNSITSYLIITFFTSKIMNYEMSVFFGCLISIPLIFIISSLLTKVDDKGIQLTKKISKILVEKVEK